MVVLLLGNCLWGLWISSVYYIQQEYAKDIREFFYGTKRQQSVQTSSSFNQRQYKKLVRGDKDALIPEEVLLRQGLNDVVIGGEFGDDKSVSSISRRSSGSIDESTSFADGLMDSNGAVMLEAKEWADGIRGERSACR